MSLEPIGFDDTPPTPAEQRLEAGRLKGSVVAGMKRMIEANPDKARGFIRDELIPRVLVRLQDFLDYGTDARTVKWAMRTSMEAANLVGAQQTINIAIAVAKETGARDLESARRAVSLANEIEGIDEDGAFALAWEYVRESLQKRGKQVVVVEAK